MEAKAWSDTKLSTGDVLHHDSTKTTLKMPDGDTLEFSRIWTLKDADGSTLIDATQASKRLDENNNLKLDDGISLSYKKQLKEWDIKYPNGDEILISPVQIDSRQLSPAEPISGSQVHVYRDDFKEHVEFLTTGSRNYLELG